MALFLDREIGSQMRGTGTPGAEGNNVSPLVEELSIPDMVSIGNLQCCEVIGFFMENVCLAPRPPQRIAKLLLEGERDREPNISSESIDSS